MRKKRKFLGASKAVGPIIFWFNKGRLFDIICTANSTELYICPISVTRVKCGIRSTLCPKIGNISGSTELFGL